MGRNMNHVLFLMLAVGFPPLILVDALPSVTKMNVQESLVQRLFELTSAEQVQKDVPLILFEQFHRAKGKYSSDVKLNFHGELDIAEFRRLLNVFDNNMFVTAWVTSSLLEAYRYGGAPKPSETQLLIALESLRIHKDKNKPYTTGARTFWPQVYNTTAKYYQSTPENLLSCFDVVDLIPEGVIDEFLDILGLKAIVPYVNQIIQFKDLYLSAFHIPPDFDDTFVNLGLGSLMFQIKEQFPEPWNSWNSDNTNISSIFDALKKYSYRPFSDDPDVNSIDPRSYFYLRHFVDDASTAGKDIALVTTWMQSITELRTEFYKGVAMPFQINNVDSTVCANTVFGITSSVLSKMVSADVLKDPAIAQIYHNTSALMAYQIKTNMTNRPDLALLYYPSQFEFDWFVSRTLAQLEEARKKSPLPAPVMEEVYFMLKDAAEGAMTKYIISKAKQDEKGAVYFDDFLGDGDLTVDNKTFIRAEDRIWTTAMAVNALLYTWTDYDETTKLSHWKEGVGSAVKQTVERSVRWLEKHTLDDNYDPWNAFFSGSFKGSSSSPFGYPTNRHEFLNGTTIHDPTHFDLNDVFAVQGHIPRDQYDAMLKEKHLGIYTPLDFHGYNSEKGFFPLWSSVPYTYATTLLALSRYNTTVT